MTKGFLKFLAIYSILFIVLIGIGLYLLNGLLIDYEKSMPNNTMKDITSEFNEKNIEKLLDDSKTEFNKLETKENIVNYYKDMLKNVKIDFKRKSGEFTNTNPVYQILAKDKVLAKVTLKEVKKNKHGFSEWAMGDVDFKDSIKAENEYLIKVPKDAVVKVNDITLDESYKTGEDVLVEETKNIKEFTPSSYYRTYKITNFISKPDIKTYLNEIELTAIINENNYNFDYPADNTLLESQMKYITTINENYGKYIINKGSLETLKSLMTGKAKQYISDIPAVWAFLWGKNYTYEFKNQKVTNMKKYSDSSFSCDIYYDLYVNYNTGNITYNTNINYTFVKINEKWVLADFRIN